MNLLYNVGPCVILSTKAPWTCSPHQRGRRRRCALRAHGQPANPGVESTKGSASAPWPGRGGMQSPSVEQFPVEHAPFKPAYAGQKRRDGRCRCGNERAPSSRRCRSCKAKYMREWRSTHRYVKIEPEAKSCA